MSKPIYISPISSRSGYGDCSRDIAKVLLDIYDNSLSFLNTSWGSCPNTELDNPTEFNNRVRSSLVNTPGTDSDITYQVALPSEFKKIGKVNVGISAGLEFTRWPDEFILGCNKMDKIIVHSEFTKNELINSNTKCTTDIQVVFQSVDETYTTEQSKYNISECIVTELLDTIPETFCFLSMGIVTQDNDRKNIKKTIDLFQHTFSDTDHDTALVLKISGPKYNTKNYLFLKEFVNKINSNYKKPKSVYLLYGNFTPRELKTLYTNSKIKSMVSLTHGEGFGRPLLEASVVGLPIIASNWSGHLDFLPPEFVQLVSGSTENVNSKIPHTTEESRWFSPDYDHAENCMVDTIQNYAGHKENAKILSKQNSDKYTYQNMKNLYNSVISDM